ncbi:hypothetical protein UlMin_015123 [Ulmus minor]
MEGYYQALTSYYSFLGVSLDSFIEEIMRAYCKLAMVSITLVFFFKELKFLMILFMVLSNQRKRVMYDASLYNLEDEEDKGFSDFIQEMVSLMAQTRIEV